MRSEFLFFTPQDFFFGQIGFESMGTVAKAIRSGKNAVTNKTSRLLLTATAVTSLVVVSSPVVTGNFSGVSAPPIVRKGPNLVAAEMSRELRKYRNYISLSQADLAR